MLGALAFNMDLTDARTGSKRKIQRFIVKGAKLTSSIRVDDAIHVDPHRMLLAILKTNPMIVVLLENKLANAVEMVQ